MLRLLPIRRVAAALSAGWEPVSTLLLRTAVRSPSVALVVLVFWASQVAALRLQVQARTRLEVHAEQVAGELRLRGRLIDVRGAGVGRAAVAVQPLGVAMPTQADPAPLALTVRTDDAGRFEAVFSRLLLPSDRELVRIESRFAGDPSHASCDTALDVRLGQAAARVELTAEPSRLTTATPSTRVELHATVGNLPLAGRTVALAIDQRHERYVVLDEDGRADVLLPTTALLPRGVHEVVATLPASADVAAAQVSLSIEVLAALQVSWELLAPDGADGAADGRSDQAACGPELRCLRGRVTLADGAGGTAGVAGAQVTIHAEKQRLGGVVSDADGRFSVRLRLDVLAELLPAGPVGLVAEAALAEPWVSPGWSEVIAIDIPAPISRAELIYGAILALLLLGVAVRLVLERWRQRRDARALAQAEAGLPAVTMQAGQGDQDLRLRGHVLDGENRRPLAAVVRIEGGAIEGAQTVATGAAGEFDFGVLVAGRWQLHVEAAGHQRLSLELLLPHDGAFDGCVLLPASLRAVVRHALSGRVAEASGRGVDWSFETPRTAEPRWLAGRRRGHARIRSAVIAAESAIYGKQIDGTIVRTVEVALDAADEGES